jgi:hypothetical protein
MKSRHKAFLLLAMGVALGVGVWVFSPRLTGTAEPWDADAPVWGITPFWTLSWLVIAVLGGLVGRVRGVCLPLGYALGQMLVTVRSVFTGQFGALGWMFIGGHAGVAVVVTLALAGAIALLKRLWRMRNAKVDGA